jgi:RNA polymerase sigma-70 factor (ECF subfamily)
VRTSTPQAGSATADSLAALVERARGGDEVAFTYLIERHQALLRRFCRRLLDNPAAGEDLTQETLIRAYLALPRLEDPTRFRAWLHGIAANLARTWWRRQARAPLSLDALEPPDASTGSSPMAATPRPPGPLTVVGPQEAVEEADRARRLRDAIGRLPPALGRTVALYYLDGYSYAEVAAALQVPVTTVKSRLFKSRARLRLVLADEDETRREPSTMEFPVFSQRTGCAGRPGGAADRRGVLCAAGDGSTAAHRPRRHRPHGRHGPVRRAPCRETST